MEMELPYVIVVGASSGIVFASATVLIIINFKRIFGCCLKKEIKIQTIENPVNPVNEWK
jgi:hypothetical protein